MNAVIAPGFADPVAQSQKAFRALLDAMARPGTVVALPALSEQVEGLSAASAAVALTLADMDTPVWLASSRAPVADWLRFHCGAPIVEAPAAAQFAFAGTDASLPALEAFDLGSDSYPDRSTTLVLEVSSLEAGRELSLSGPGIDGQARLCVEGLEPTFWESREQMRALFPRGIDMILTCGAHAAALPRTTRVDF